MRRASHRGRWFSLALVALLGALGFFGIRRSKLVLPPPSLRVPPPPPRATVRVCWLETSRFLDLTASALLVQHPQGAFLVDAGANRDLRAMLKTVAWWRRPYALLALAPSLPLPDALRKVGVAPADLRGVLISHQHPDHLGGALDLPPTVPIWTLKEELAWATKMQLGPEGLPALSEALARRGQPLTLQPVPYELFAHQADLFGDGSVVIVPLPGHSPGSLGVFLQLPNGQRLFYVGDAVNASVEVTQGLSKRGFFRLSDWNGVETARSVAKLKQLQDEVPELALLPAHDRSAFERVFGGNPRCLP